MAVKVKGTPSGIKSLLSGTGASGPGNGVHGPVTRESRNKMKVDQNPSAAPKRPSSGASAVKRALSVPKAKSAPSAVSSEVAQPQAYGQPFGM